jgi:large subunit ribosomal protein L5
MNNLKNYYLSVIVPKLLEKFKYKNISQIPKLKKIIINRGLGLNGQNRNYLLKAFDELRIISCQHPVIILAKKSIVPFKIKKGIPIGLKVTLRNTKMYDFLEKLIHLVFPRIQDFRGLKTKNFDEFGNYNFGLSDQLIFPEINYENVEQKRGFNISLIFYSRIKSKQTKLENIFLLQKLNFPLIN